MAEECSTPGGPPADNVCRPNQQIEVDRYLSNQHLDSPPALRAGEKATRPAVRGPTLCVDSPAALRAGEPAALRAALGECLNTNSPATLRAGELAKAKCPPPDTLSAGVFLPFQVRVCPVSACLPVFRQAGSSYIKTR